MTDKIKKPNFLIIITWIAQSVKNKEDELYDYLTTNNVDILLLVQETHLKASDSLQFSNYDTYKTDRTNGRNEGTAMIIKKT